MNAKERLFQILENKQYMFKKEGLENAEKLNIRNKGTVNALLNLPENGTHTETYTVDAKIEVLERVEKLKNELPLTSEGVEVFSNIENALRERLDGDLKVDGMKFGRFVRKELIKASSADSDKKEIDDLVTKLSDVHQHEYTLKVTTNMWEILMMSEDAHFTSCMAIGSDYSYNKGTLASAVDDCTVMVVVLDSKGRKVFRQLYFVTNTTLIPSRVYSQNGTDRYTETVLKWMLDRLYYEEGKYHRFTSNKNIFISSEGSSNTYNDFLEGHDSAGMYVRVTKAVPTPASVCWHCGKEVSRDDLDMGTGACSACTPQDECSIGTYNPEPATEWLFVEGEDEF